jgi:hypothetical protein
MFCSKIKSQIKSALQHFDSYIDAHVDTALKVTTALKNIINSPVADIVTALIPGSLDNTIKAKLLDALNNALQVLNIVDDCKQYTSLNDKLNCFVQEVKKRDPQLQDAILQKLASLISGQLDGNRLKQYLYDLYTQAKYSIAK